jgi:hypothetical protein
MLEKRTLLSPAVILEKGSQGKDHICRPGMSESEQPGETDPAGEKPFIVQRINADPITQVPFEVSNCDLPACRPRKARSEDNRLR